MQQTEKTRLFIQGYFAAVNERQVDRIAIADDCTYRGSMLSEPVVGAAAVREHIAAVVPFIDRYEVLRSVADGSTGAVHVRFSGMRGKTIEGAMFFEVEDGQLVSLDNLFDTRLLLNG